jgi:hypothetical protein
MVSVTITPTPNEEQLPLPKSVTEDAIILPERITKDGIGLYVPDAISAYKQLKSEGLNVAYLNESDQRKWIGRHGIPSQVVDFAIALSAHVSYDAVMALLHRKQSEGKVRIRVAQYKNSSRSTAWEWLDIEGPASEVIDALKELSQSKLSKK